MDDRKTIAFEGREYFDDLLYILTICPARTHANSEGLIYDIFKRNQHVVDKHRVAKGR
jgi:hypothetical protein